MRQGKKGNFPDQNKFEGPGVDFKCKLIGFTDVSAARGDEICLDALSALKETALRNQKEKKEHKQKLILNITLKGIRLIDESTERIDHAHAISRISFISHDKCDKRVFGYIMGTKEGGYKLFAIKTMKEAEVITSTIKELFQEVFRRHQAKKEEDEEHTSEFGEGEEGEQNGQIEDVPETDDGDAPSIPSDVINDPFGAGGTGTVQCSERSDPFDDNFTSMMIPVNQNNVNLLHDEVDCQSFSNTCSSSSDIFSLAADHSFKETSENKSTLLKHDPFDDLKKSIDVLHKQNVMRQQQQQQMTGFPPPLINQQSPFPINQPNPYAPNVSNPFISGSGCAYNSFPIPSQPLPPVVPTRPVNSVTNPFSSNQHPSSNQNPSVEPAAGGWAVFDTFALDKKEGERQHAFTSDPFSFLDGSSTWKATSQPIVAPCNNHSVGNKELLDLLG